MMDRRSLRQMLPYLLTAAVLIALATVFLLSRRPVNDAEETDPAGRVYVSEAGERSAAEAQSQIREARKNASDAASASTAKPSVTPTEPSAAPTEPSAAPTDPSETVPPVPTESSSETLPTEPSEPAPPATEPAETTAEPVTDAPTEPPAETTPEPPVETTSPGTDQLLASLQEQIRTLNVDLFTPDELAAYRRRFDNTVFTGDSMAQGLVSFELFDENHVKFKRGASVGEFDEEIQAAIDTLPDCFVFFTGCNNVSTYINDPTEYYRQFVSRIEWVKRALPGTEIYVICMLPASDRFIKYENYHVARQPEYDAQLKLVCQDTGVHYVDCHWMVRQELYLEDGLHFNLAFYTVLIKFLAIEMGL